MLNAYFEIYGITRAKNERRVIHDRGRLLF